MSTQEVRIIAKKGSDNLLQEKPTKVIDTTGEICPYPALYTRRAFAEMNRKGILEVITNNEPTAIESIPLLCDKEKFEYVVVAEGDHWRIKVRMGS